MYFVMTLLSYEGRISNPLLKVSSVLQRIFSGCIFEQHDLAGSQHMAGFFVKLKLVFPSVAQLFFHAFLMPSLPSFSKSLPNPSRPGPSTKPLFVSYF